MIQLVEIVEAPIATNIQDKFHVRQIYVSPEHIVMVREDNLISRTLKENNIVMPGISSNTMQFAKLTINRGTTGQDITVLGSVEMIYEKINSSRSKQLLRG